MNGEQYKIEFPPHEIKPNPEDYSLAFRKDEKTEESAKEMVKNSDQKELEKVRTELARAEKDDPGDEYYGRFAKFKEEEKSKPKKEAKKEKKETKGESQFRRAFMRYLTK